MEEDYGEFTCEHCKGVFDKEWSDEEDEEEYRKEFPELVGKEIPIMLFCDDCYKEFREWFRNLSEEIREMMLQETIEDAEGKE